MSAYDVVLEPAAREALRGLPKPVRDEVKRMLAQLAVQAPVRTIPRAKAWRTHAPHDTFEVGGYLFVYRVCAEDRTVTLRRMYTVAPPKRLAVAAGRH